MGKGDSAALAPDPGRLVVCASVVILTRLTDRSSRLGLFITMRATSTKPLLETKGATYLGQTFCHYQCLTDTRPRVGLVVHIELRMRLYFSYGSNMSRERLEVRTGMHENDFPSEYIDSIRKQSGL